MIVYGEDVRDWGGCFDVTRGLGESLPYQKVFNAPISESAIVGSAVGYAMAGGKAIVEIMYQDFMACSGDEILNQLAKWQAMSAGALKLPIVLRTVVGSKHGAQHTQDLSAFWAHIPGLKVVYPVTPRDAAGLLNRSLNGSDPVIFIESQIAYDQKEIFGDLESIDQMEIDLGQPIIRRSGKDLTILTLGPILFRAIKAADILSKEYGIEVEIIDMRGLVPFDYTLVKASVDKTRRILLASDEVTRGSSLNDVAQKITQLCFNRLDVAPVVIGSKNWIAPADEYDKYFFPQVSTFLDVIHLQLIPLEGYSTSGGDPLKDLITESKKGL